MSEGGGPLVFEKGSCEMEVWGVWNGFESTIESTMTEYEKTSAATRAPLANPRSLLLLSFPTFRPIPGGPSSGFCEPA